MSLKFASEFIIWDVTFRSLRSISSGIVDSAQFLMSGDKTGIDQLDQTLESLDIENRVKLLDVWIENQKPASETANLSIQGIRDMVLRIKQTLASIDSRRLDHAKKWFSSYRQLDCRDLTGRLETQCRLLDQRVAFYQRLK